MAEHAQAPGAARGPAGAGPRGDRRWCTAGRRARPPSEAADVLFGGDPADGIAEAALGPWPRGADGGLEPGELGAGVALVDVWSHGLGDVEERRPPQLEQGGVSVNGHGRPAASARAATSCTVGGCCCAGEDSCARAVRRITARVMRG